MSRWEYVNRWALVTGASSGLGEAFSRALAARGGHLVLAARRGSRLEALAAELSHAHGVRCEVVPVDLSEPDGPARLWREASRGREVHLLVNNAGLGSLAPFHEEELGRILEMVRVNVSAVAELMHRALPGMLARGEGGVINLSSTTAFQPLPRLATYAASKAFVQHLSEAVWAECRERGVRVLALAPGRVATEFQEVAGTSPVRSGPGVLPAEVVVDKALRALERGRALLVPGITNTVGSVLPRLGPRGLVARAAGAVVRRIL